MSDVAVDSREMVKIDNSTILNLDAGKMPKYNAKFTLAKRKTFLKEYAKDLNFSRASRVCGVTRATVFNHINSDQRFSHSIEEIKHAYVDQAESALFTVAMQPSRDSFQAQKLVLQSHRRKTYGDKVQIDQNVQVTQTTAVVHIDAVLGGIPTIDTPKSLPNGHTQAIDAEVISTQVDKEQVVSK